MRKLSVLLLLLLAACGGGGDSVPQSLERAGATPSAEPIPPDVQITVLNESTIPGVRRSLDVRISRRVTEPELRAIAEDLKARDPNRYDRTFIVYYLPGMQTGAGGWATSHFNPDLEVRVLGTTGEQELALAATAAPASSEEVIGVWVGDQPFLPARITLYREDGRVMMLRTYSDGSGSPMEVTQTQVSSGTRYQWSGSGGDYLLVTSAGTLEMRDAEGLIASFRPAS